MLLTKSNRINKLITTFRIIRIIEKLSRGKREKLKITRKKIVLSYYEGIFVEFEYLSLDRDGNFTITVNIENAYYLSLCGLDSIINKHIVLNTLEDIIDFFSNNNYRKYYQKYIRNYRKPFKLGEKLNRLFKSIPLNQQIQLDSKDKDLLINIFSVEPVEMITDGIITNILVKTNGLIDINCYNHRAGVILNTKGITMEVGTNLLDVIYTDFLKLKKRTH